MTHRKVTICENCRTTLQGDFCHECGQRGVELRRPVFGLVQDIIVETLSIDGRLWRTIKGLFLNPGHVATEYVEGHRMRFTPPFRIFLFFSLVYFFTLFTVVENGQGNVNVGPGAQIEVEANEAAAEKPVPDGPAEVPAEQPPNTDPDPESTDDGISDDNIGLSATIDEDGNFNYHGPDFLRPFAERMADNIELAQEDPRLFLAQLRENMPRALLLMPGVYVMLLMMLYFYKKPYMYDLLIISLYMHAALYFYLFLALVFQILPDLFYLGDIAAFLVQMFGLFQSYRVLRTAFGSGWLSVAIKGTIINSAFWTIALVAMLIGLALSLY